VSPCVCFMLCRLRLRSISDDNFFFLDFFNFCWVFQNFPFFLSPCIFNSNIEFLLLYLNLIDMTISLQMPHSADIRHNYSIQNLHPLVTQTVSLDDRQCNTYRYSTLP
jgi:hypothetical protein